MEAAGTEIVLIKGGRGGEGDDGGATQRLQCDVWGCQPGMKVGSYMQ